MSNIIIINLLVKITHGGSVMHVFFTNLMMSHVSLRAIEQSFKLKPVRVPIGNHVAHLSHYRGKYEHSNQIAHYCKHVSVNRV